MPSGRWRTVPVTFTTYSLRRSSAPGTTHWITPVRSRTSTKARCSPCSRRVATQPQSTTSRPSSAVVSSPHQSVRMPCLTSPPRAPAPTAASGVVISAAPLPTPQRCHSRSDRVDNVVHAHLFLGAVGAQVAQGDHARRRLVLAHDGGEPGPAAIGGLHLGLHRPSVEAAVGADAGSAQGAGQVAGQSPPVTSTTKTSTAESGTGQASSASAASRMRSMPNAEADARRGRSAHGLGQTVVAPAPADRVLGGVQGLGLQLEGRARVVVEAPDQAGLDRERDPQRVEAGLDPVEVGGGGLGEVLGRTGGVGHHHRGGGALGVEDPQRVVVDLLAVLIGQGRSTCSRK